MSVAFQCPSCLRQLYYESGETPFQVCYHCKGKIIVPSTVVHQVEIKEERPTEYALREQRDLKLAEIQNELSAGRKIQAIKLFRQAFGTDLQTAKEEIERLEANKKMNIATFDPQEQRDLKLAEIQNELNAGRKIPAIKIFRQAFGTDLQTAKEEVERLAANEKINLAKYELQADFSVMQGNSATQNNLVQKGQPPKIGQLIMTLIYIIIGVAVFFWLMD